MVILLNDNAQAKSKSIFRSAVKDSKKVHVVLLHALSANHQVATDMHHRTYPLLLLRKVTRALSNMLP